MQNKIILGLVGEIASGKGTVVKYLEEKHKAASYRFSTPIRDVLNRLYLEINRKNMQAMSLVLRERFGQDLFAKIIGEDVKNDNNNIVVVDGIRRPADIAYLSKQPEFKLIYITADIETRFKRITAREENKDDNGKTMEEFKRDHEAETELEIPNIGAEADIKIINNGSKEELYMQIDKIIKKNES